MWGWASACPLPTRILHPARQGSRTEKYSDELREKQFAVMREAQKYVLDLQNWHDFLKALIAGRLSWRGT